MCKCNVCAFLYPSSDPSMEEIFDRIVEILHERDKTFCCFTLKDININGKTEEDIAQEFMDKITMGFKEEKNV
jgi:hypothetical protein